VSSFVSCFSACPWAREKMVSERKNGVSSIIRWKNELTPDFSLEK
jgi:hypothetical protein